MSDTNNPKEKTKKRIGENPIPSTSEDPIARHRRMLEEDKQRRKVDVI